MSRSYSIRIPIEVLLSHSFREKMAGFKLNFPLLEVLPVEQMRALVRQKLLEAGFIETPEGLAMPLNEGEQAIIDPETMEMTLSIALPEGQTKRVYEEVLAEVEGRIRNALKTGDTIADNLSSILNEQLARQMTDMAINARSQVNAALKEVYRDAVKEKAGKLGSVASVTESSEGGVYRIRVEVSQ